MSVRNYTKVRRSHITSHHIHSLTMLIDLILVCSDSDYTEPDNVKGNYEWPVTLPPKLLRDGFQIQPTEVIIVVSNVSQTYNLSSSPDQPASSHHHHRVHHLHLLRHQEGGREDPHRDGHRGEQQHRDDHRPGGAHAQPATLETRSGRYNLNSGSVDHDH